MESSMSIVGRKAEQAELVRLQASPRPEFIAVYGRRRVGKTFLVRECFKDSLCFVLTGKAKSPMREQLRAFDSAAREYGTRRHPRAKTWQEAFSVLRAIIEESTQRGKKVVFLDEMPWLATDRSGFLSALEHFWNSWGSTRADLLLIVCGSATTWMVDKLLKDTGGLYNRITGTIYLRPFSLGECKALYEELGIAMSRHQMVESYMVFGGIPYYLSLMKPQLGFAQNVDALCFEEGSVLADEFERLYRSLFKQADNYIASVRALSTRATGLTREEIASEARLANGGRLTKTLDDLIHSGFVRKYHAFGKKERGSLYQLIDPFSLFYLRFMEGSAYRDRHYWSNYSATASHSAWSGYAFEQVALLHTDQIRQALGISGVLSDFSAWRGIVDGTDAQIDLVIDRNDGTINLCEMKFRLENIVVDREMERATQRKRSVFYQASRTRKAIQLTLVTTYGLERNAHAGVFQSVVTMDDLFVETR
jgi:AAA+ ATPase superfamily predicted ATPase